MEPQAAQEVYDEIVAYIKKRGGTYPQWYCGIAADWEDRLFNEHQVPREGLPWIALQCHNNGSARNTESALHDLRCDGGPGGGDETTVYVYAYRKDTMTEP